MSYYLELLDDTFKALLKDEGRLSIEQVEELGDFKKVFFLLAQHPSFLVL